MTKKLKMYEQAHLILDEAFHNRTLPNYLIDGIYHAVEHARCFRNLNGSANYSKYHRQLIKNTLPILENKKIDVAPFKDIMKVL